MFSHPLDEPNSMIGTFLEWPWLTQHFGIENFPQFLMYRKIEENLVKIAEFTGIFSIYRKLGNLRIDWVPDERDRTEFKGKNQFFKNRLNDFCLGFGIRVNVWAAYEV